MKHTKKEEIMQEIIELYDVVNAQKKAAKKFEQYADMLYRSLDRSCEKFSEGLLSRESINLVESALWMCSEIDILEDKIIDLMRDMRRRSFDLKQKALDFSCQENIEIK
jgi:hypothetical protein